MNITGTESSNYQKYDLKYHELYKRYNTDYNNSTTTAYKKVLNDYAHYIVDIENVINDVNNSNQLLVGTYKEIAEMWKTQCEKLTEILTSLNVQNLQNKTIDADNPE